MKGGISGMGALLALATGLTGLAGLAGCQSAGHEPDPKFVALYAELKLASAALEQDLERAAEVRRAVLARHGMTPAEFHEQYMQLAGHPEAWRPFQERVLAEMDAFLESRKDTSHGRQSR